MLHQDQDLLHPRHQVHGAAHAFDHLAGDHPIGEVTLLADLHRAQDRQIDLATADHGKAFVAAKNAGARDSGDGLLARVDDVGVDFILGGKRAYAQHAVLALQPHLDVGAHEVGHQGWQANAQVHVVAVFEFLRCARSHLIVRPGHGQAPTRSAGAGFSVSVRRSMRFSGCAFTTMRCT